MSIVRRKLEGVTYYDPAKAFNGYTLLTPMGSTDAWLINIEGEIVHHWRLPYLPGMHGTFLENGNFLYAGQTKALDPALKQVGFIVLGGRGGEMLEVDWDNNLVWKWEDHYQNHTFARLKNGNTMLLRWVRVPNEVVDEIEGGLAGSDVLESGEKVMWADGFHEVAPDGRIVWEWLPWEHVNIKDFSICPLCTRREWTHGNTVFEMPNGDILTSFRSQSSIFTIDKKTGKIKWMWGRGEITHQHDPSLVDNGNILVFDNGNHRQDGSGVSYSRVVEVNPRTNKIEWEYKDDPPGDFYTSIMGACQRLPNGNTLISETDMSRIFEVTRDGEIVWEYISPFYNDCYHDTFGRICQLFKAYRYSPDFPGFKGKDLNPKNYAVENRLFGPDAWENV